MLNQAFMFILGTHRLARGPASIFVPIVQMRFVFTALVGAVLFQGLMSGRKLAGMLITIAGFGLSRSAKRLAAIRALNPRLPDLTIENCTHVQPRHYLIRTLETTAAATIDSACAQGSAAK